MAIGKPVLGVQMLFPCFGSCKVFRRVGMRMDSRDRGTRERCSGIASSFPGRGDAQARAAQRLAVNEGSQLDLAVVNWRKAVVGFRGAKTAREREEERKTKNP